MPSRTGQTSPTSPTGPTSQTSIVLPTYNEAGSIVRLLREVLDVVDRAHLDAELIIADDRSPDGTAALIRRSFAGESRVRVIERDGRRGLALSIREGLAAANGEVFVVMDADFNHDPQILPALVRFTADFGLVSGSRFAPGGGMYSRTRQAGSFVMNLFARVVLQTQIQDNLSGYFAVRRADYGRLPHERIFWGYGDYYFRLLWYARHLGISILEIPVVYRSREGGGSKTPLLRTALRYTWEIVAFRFRAGAAA